MHHEYCKSNEAIKINLPKEGSTISLTHYYRSTRVRFIVYAEFESFTPQLSICQQNPESSYTKQYQEHARSEFCYHIKYFNDTLFSRDTVTFVKDSEDDDVAHIFIETLEQNIEEIYKTFKFPKKWY